MPAKELVAGAGTRYGVVFELDADTGLPMPAAASQSPYVGEEIYGIKSASATDPGIRRITHLGMDRPLAQDTLPSTDAETFQFTTSVTNFRLDNVLEGTETREYTNFNSRLVNSEGKGDEAQVAAFFYRQAIDVDPNSATKGKLRQWNGRTYPSTRISTQTDAYEQAEVDKTYEGSPSSSTLTPWGETFSIANWGRREGFHMEHTFSAHPRWNFYRGNGTLTSFHLSHPPVDSDHLNVWVDGTLATPSGVDTSVTNPAFTLGSAATNDKLVAALIMTNNP
jgi:hypothetical protein